jgi:hypothetical protein
MSMFVHFKYHAKIFPSLDHYPAMKNGLRMQMEFLLILMSRGMRGTLCKKMLMRSSLQLRGKGREKEKRKKGMIPLHIWRRRQLLGRTRGRR